MENTNWNLATRIMFRVKGDDVYLLYSLLNILISKIKM